MTYNEIIQDIMYKADEAEIPYDEDYGKTDFLADRDPRRVEIFAKMIIEKCVSLCKNVEEDTELSDYEGGFRDGALLCQEEIKEHFGVK